MPVEGYVGQLEPENQDAEIWRFVNMKKFRDFIDTGELYFCRADLFPQDETEGLPPDGYKPFPHLNPLDLKDRRQIDDSIGNVAQFREAFYINCWHLFREETCRMWEKYGQDGVAICSRYRLLKTELNALKDRAFIGLVRYGSAHMEGWNLTPWASSATFEEIRSLVENKGYTIPVQPSALTRFRDFLPCSVSK